MAFLVVKPAVTIKQPVTIRSAVQDMPTSKAAETKQRQMGCTALALLHELAEQSHAWSLALGVEVTLDQRI